MLGLDNLRAVIANPELRAMLKSVASRKINSDLKTLQAHAELSRRLSDSRRISSGDGEELKRIVKEHLQFYGTLIDLSITFHQRLIDMLAETASGTPAEPAINGLTLTMKAPKGATVRAPFKIANNRAEPIQVRCKASPFVSEDGSQLIASGIAFSPPGAEIAPGSEEVFEAILPIGADFAVGQTYLGTLSTEGLEAMEIVVRLSVEPAAVEPAPKGATRARAAKPANQVDAITAKPAPSRVKRANAKGKPKRQTRSAAGKSIAVS